MEVCDFIPAPPKTLSIKQAIVVLLQPCVSMYGAVHKTSSIQGEGGLPKDDLI